MVFAFLQYGWFISGGTPLIKPVYSSATVETEVPSTAVLTQKVKPLALETR